MISPPFTTVTSPAATVRFTAWAQLRAQAAGAGAKRGRCRQITKAHAQSVEAAHLGTGARRALLGAGVGVQ